VARPAWYDRNPESKILSYFDTVGPHSETERWSYTCPSGKKAMVEVLFTRAVRLEAATTPQNVFADIAFKPSGGVEKYILAAIIPSAQNNVGDRDMATIAASLMLMPGDKIRAITADAGTGGTVQYLITVKLTEFDA